MSDAESDASIQLNIASLSTGSSQGEIVTTQVKNILSCVSLLSAAAIIGLFRVLLLSLIPQQVHLVPLFLFDGSSNNFLFHFHRTEEPHGSSMYPTHIAKCTHL